MKKLFLIFTGTALVVSVGAFLYGSFYPTVQASASSVLEKNSLAASAKSESLDFLNKLVPSSVFDDEEGVGIDNLSKIFNQLFYLGLLIAVVLAVIMIIRGGVEYMTSDAISGKDEGKKRIRAALGGLLLAFSTILILNTINPNITDLKIKFAQIKKVTPITLTGGLPAGSSGGSGGTVTGAPGVPGANGAAVFTSISDPSQRNAYADGVITINGVAYNFRSGGGGNGFLPPGTYTVTNGRERYDKPTMIVGGFGYSFDLENKYDPRLGIGRDELRIHPDGGNPGTIGCIGIQGDAATQRQFYSDLSTAIKNNGGSYTISVGQ